jgi:hypothetical protein
MFERNPRLRGINEPIEYTEELKYEVVKCKTDIIYFAENYFWIVDGDGNRHKIKLYDYQKRMLKCFVSPPNGKQNIAVLSSRQVGKTSIYTIYALHYALMNKDKTIIILGNRKKTAMEIMKRIRFAYELLPLFLQMGIKEWNKSSIVLENGSRIVTDSTVGASSRGDTAQCLVLDEFSHVPDAVASDFMSAVYPVISSGKNTKIIIVSTANGLNHFYKLFTKALEGKDDPTKGNSYYPLKINWREVPGRDLAFKKKVIADNSLAMFQSEYECKFLGAADSIIDSSTLESIQFTEPKMTKYSGALQIFEEPQQGCVYVIGADTGKGVEQDFSVAQIIKINNQNSLEQVAIYRNNMIAPHNFAQILISISEYYNNCGVLIESNDASGSLCCNSFWYEYECDRLINFDSKGLGIIATRANKPKAVLLMKNYLEEEKLIIHCKQTLYELSRFVEVRPNCFEAENRGVKDDCVTSLYWTIFYINSDLYDGRSDEVKQIEDQYKITDDDLPVMVFDNGL